MQTSHNCQMHVHIVRSVNNSNSDSDSKTATTTNLILITRLGATIYRHITLCIPYYSKQNLIPKIVSSMAVGVGLSEPVLLNRQLAHQIIRFSTFVLETFSI